MVNTFSSKWFYATDSPLPFHINHGLASDAGFFCVPYTRGLWISGDPLVGLGRLGGVAGRCNPGKLKIWRAGPKDRMVMVFRKVTNDPGRTGAAKPICLIRRAITFGTIATSFVIPSADLFHQTGWRTG